MLRHFPLLLAVGCHVVPATADNLESRFSSPFAERSGQTTRGTDQTEIKLITNRNIVGPTGELLPPELATRTLGEQDYFEWCLRWNRLQHALATERAIPPQIISGRLTQRDGYSRSSWNGRFFGNARSATSYRSTTRSREEVWHLGGYGGGPVTLYNPFVPTTAIAPP